MILKFGFLDNEITFTNSYINVLEVENKKYFYRIVEELLLANNGSNSEEVTFFDSKYKEQNLNNKLKIIIDYFNLDFDNKKYISEVHKSISNLIDDATKHNILSNYNKMCNTLKKIIDDIDIPLVINEELDFDSLFKLIKVSINSKTDLLENLLLLIDIEKTFNINKLLVFVNLKQYLSVEELSELYKYAIYNNVYIMLIDSQAYGTCTEYEKKLIIDQNLDEFVI